jgi:hypothetical protein
MEVYLMTILPINDPTKARQQLDQAIADRYTITMLVFGDGNGEDQIASQADIRAEALASTRRVVWVRDTSILTSSENQQYRKGSDDIIVCTLNLDDKPVVHLNRSKASNIIDLELAFAKAQQG